MAVNKVEANDETLIDLTGDTVTADTLLAGRTAHLASGDPVTGTFDADGMQEQIDYNTNKINSLVGLVVGTPQNHNGIFRGKDLTRIYTVDQMYNMVHSGNFDDLFLGDWFHMRITTDVYTQAIEVDFEEGTYYERSGDSLLDWTYTEISEEDYDDSKTYYTKETCDEHIPFMFAAFDYYYNVGDPALTTHHAILIPRNHGFGKAANMNPTNTTTNGYLNSEMHQTTLPCYAKSLRTALNNHLLSHRTAETSLGPWTTVELQLMNEIQVYGTTVFPSSSVGDSFYADRYQGVDNRQLPVFKFINPVQYDASRTFWLSSVATSRSFAYCGAQGEAGYGGASSALYVRPLILFG